MPRAFLDDHAAADQPALGNDELRYPLFAQLLGYPVADTGFRHAWHCQADDPYFNVLGDRNIRRETRSPLSWPNRTAAAPSTPSARLCASSAVTGPRLDTTHQSAARDGATRSVVFSYGRVLTKRAHGPRRPVHPDEKGRLEEAEWFQSGDENVFIARVVGEAGWE
ncbi:hypothetical protein [Streptomyces griseorubiginosus]|uniref:hypothetical protein n=1 Tax=Streptomyces griseorubiginosus TaxID=67304 RepID=UPI0036B8C4DC